MTTEPTAPIELTGTADHLAGEVVTLGDDVVAQLQAICETITDEHTTAEASRDWWPLALHWALDGSVARRAGAVVRPTSRDEIVAVGRCCSAAGVPITAAGGRSGVSGASIPVHGGVVLDLTALRGLVEVDEVSGIVAVLAGTFGPDLEDELRERHGLTVGHFPQSFELATVGGWVACRGAGQYSTRYGKIEQMVVGLEVVLADGTVVHTGGAPAAATGPDLGQLFIGSEGTLGIITTVWLRARPLPEVEQRASYLLSTLDEGFEACRQILRSGATPAVLRLYDAVESSTRGGDGSNCLLLVLDEGEPSLVAATMDVVAARCAGGVDAGTEPVDEWFEHRNDTSALQALTRKGYVVDTMEIAAPWSRLSEVVAATSSAQMAVPHALVSSCHLSHSYLDGACLYFTFAAKPPADAVESTYVAMWDAGQRAVLASGGNLSHHHGVGLNRARFAAEALGEGHAVLAAVKSALDPGDILNPGKFGLPSQHGDPGWP